MKVVDSKTGKEETVLETTTNSFLVSQTKIIKVVDGVVIDKGINCSQWFSEGDFKKRFTRSMNEHDSIVTKETLYCEYGVIPQGTSGCIVHVYNADNFEVELFNPKKETIGVVTLNAKQIQQV